MEQLPEAVRLQIYQYAQTEAAKLNNVSPNQQITFYDAAKKLGIIGVVKDGPVDLSSDPRHMEGFGS